MSMNAKGGHQLFKKKEKKMLVSSFSLMLHFFCLHLLLDIRTAFSSISPQTYNATPTAPIDVKKAEVHLKAQHMQTNTSWGDLNIIFMFSSWPFRPVAGGNKKSDLSPPPVGAFVHGLKSAAEMRGSEVEVADEGREEVM